MFDFNGRVALVTGAGQGIGAATAELFVELGARVVAADLDEASVNALQDAHGNEKVAVVRTDVTRAGDADRAVTTAVERFGRLDILVNNAGITRDELLFRLTENDFDAVLATHLRGAFLCSKAAQAPMVDQGYGKIVNLSSRSALGNRGQVNYSAAKAGLIGMTRTMAIELGPRGINVNAVAPGFIETAMTRGIADKTGVDFEAIKDDVVAKTPVRRVGVPRDVANLIAFLSSDAASYISGETVWIAGGPVGVV